GNTGLSIFFNLLSRQTNNPEYEKLADDLLDKAFANLTTSASADFENGLAGIGWGIEYLVQHGFAEGDTDEILEEVDNKVFRSLNEENHTSIELGNGLTGYLFYLISRLKDKPESRSMAQRINRELLILTVNKIDELATAQFPTLVKEIQFDLFWRFPVMLYGLSEAFKLNAYNAKIRCMVRQWLPYFESYIPSMHINRLFLAVVLERICSLMPESRLEKQGRILLFATDFKILKTEVDHDLLNIRFGWPGAAWLLKIASEEIPAHWPNQHLICRTYHEIMAIHQNPLESFAMEGQQNNYIQFGVSLGLAGIGLLEIVWPGVLSGNFTNETHGDD
ncbi:MAG: lanthionine synthetase LanC family protein, partial [Bacteroidia bacterium]